MACPGRPCAQGGCGHTEAGSGAGGMWGPEGSLLPGAAPVSKNLTVPHSSVTK